MQEFMQLRYIVSYCALLFSLPLFSKQLLLDEVMTQEEQRRTGVANLTPNQKIALEQWINKNCNCSAQNAPEESKQPPLFLSLNLDNGEKIQLNDGSIWEVDPEDYPISQAWLSPMPLKIIPSGNYDYPFLLVNKNTGISIKVRKFTPPPPAPIPPPPSSTTPNSGSQLPPSGSQPPSSNKQGVK